MGASQVKWDAQASCWPYRSVLLRDKGRCKLSKLPQAAVVATGRYKGLKMRSCRLMAVLKALQVSSKLLVSAVLSKGSKLPMTSSWNRSADENDSIGTRLHMNQPWQVSRGARCFPNWSEGSTLRTYCARQCGRASLSVTAQTIVCRQNHISRCSKPSPAESCGSRWRVPGTLEFAKPWSCKKTRRSWATSLPARTLQMVAPTVTTTILGPRIGDVLVAGRLGCPLGICTASSDGKAHSLTGGTIVLYHPTTRDIAKGTPCSTSDASTAAHDTVCIQFCA